MRRRSDSESRLDLRGAGRERTANGRRAAAKPRHKANPASSAKPQGESDAIGARIEARLDDALAATFPASDPVAITRVDR